MPGAPAGSSELRHCCASSLNRTEAPVSLPGHCINNQMAAMVVGLWFLKFSWMTSWEDLSGFFATMCAASLAFAQSSEDQRGTFCGDISDLQDTHTYLISMHVGHVFKLRDPDSVFLW